MPKICADDSQCENRPGSFVCKCDEGYIYDKRGCLGKNLVVLIVVIVIYLRVVPIYCEKL